MDKDKSILEKFTDTVKDIASTATEAASQALKADEPGLRADERAAAYVPLAADGLVSDPLMVPPVAAAPATAKARGEGAANRNRRQGHKGESRKVKGREGRRPAGEAFKEGGEPIRWPQVRGQEIEQQETGRSDGKKVGIKVGRERQESRQENHPESGRKADGEEIPRQDTARLTAPTAGRANRQAPRPRNARVTPARASCVASGDDRR